MADDKQRIYLIRHGATEWSENGRHTGTTDLPLTEKGRAAALRMREVLVRLELAQVFASPMQRARETCTLSGVRPAAAIDADLSEWNYGDYEGLTTEEISRTVPGWMIFDDGCPGGEMPEDVARRADRMIAKARKAAGNVAMFSHGHFLRVFVARWLDLPASQGKNFLLDTATLNVLGYYYHAPAVQIWNAPIVASG